MHWHTLNIETIEKQLGTNAKNGIGSIEAQGRLKTYGENRLIEKKPRSFIRRFFAQLEDFMVIVLMIAAVVSILMQFLQPPEHREYIDSIIIFAIVLLNALLGVIQESKAEQSLSALKKMSSPQTKVIRDGRLLVLDSALVVPGDLCSIEAGDFIPADGRLVETASLRIEESALTGESLPVEKDATLVFDEETTLAERKNMAYSGTHVAYGRGILLVTGTGMQTATGKIADLLQSEVEQQTPLQARLVWLGKRLGILALIICSIVFALGIYQKRDFLEMFMTSVALAVAAIPEGLPAIVTIVLALGVQRMAGKHSIVRKLPAVETLGSASVICSDKTGTLTQNRMTLVKAYVDEITDLNPDNQKIRRLIQLASLCCDAKIETDEKGNQVSIGDPTEIAIVAATAIYQDSKQDLVQKYPRLGEIPFDSDRKLMSSLHEIDGRLTLIVKGAPDILLSLCSLENSTPAQDANMKMAGEALRVLAVAIKHLDAMPTEFSPEALERDLTFIGLVGMIDPPRPEAKKAVATCKHAGIRTVMITGDNVGTASAIARELGILEHSHEATTGAMVTKMNDDELFEKIRNFRVFARVTPEDKIRIVKAWQRTGAVVAMTGDGVNDAPALKAADIGCAMGITGTDVAKGAADMVLTDDNFATIVLAVKEGRGIYANIQRSIQFLLGSNLSEIFTVFFAMLLGWGTPLLALHILWINLVTDSLPALALGVEPISEHIMNEKPRPKNEGLFSRSRALTILFHGLMLGTLTLTAFCLGAFGIIAPPPGISASVGFGPPFLQVGQSMAFAVLAISQLFHAFNNRSNFSIFKIGLFSNKSMLYAFIVSLLLMIAVLIPPLSAAFGVSPLSPAHWIAIFALSIAPIIIVELQKLIGMNFCGRKGK